MTKTERQSNWRGRSGLPLGERVYLFGSNEDGHQALMSGWCAPETGFVWSNAKLASVRLPVTSARNIFRLSLWAYVCRKVPQQDVLIFVDGRLVQMIEIDRLMEVEFQSIGDLHLPDQFWCDISFYIPYAISPQEAEGSNDPRRLGVALAKCVVLPVL